MPYIYAVIGPLKFYFKLFKIIFGFWGTKLKVTCMQDELQVISLSYLVIFKYVIRKSEPLGKIWTQKTLSLTNKLQFSYF